MAATVTTILRRTTNKALRRSHFVNQISAAVSFNRDGKLYTGIKFARSMESPDPAILWIDDEPHIRQLLTNDVDVNGLCFICAGAAEDLPGLAAKRGALLKAFDTDLMTLYDCVSGQLMHYQDWERSILKAELSLAPIQSVIDLAASKLGGTVVLLNVEQQAIYFGGVGACSFSPLRNATVFGHLPCLSDMHFDSVNDCSDVGEGWLCRRQNFSGKLIRQILLFFRDDTPLYDIDVMLSLLCESFVRILKSGRAASKKCTTLGSVFPDIVRGVLKDECEIDQLLSQTEHPPKQFCSFGVVSFSHERIISSVQHSLANQLTDIFPGSSFTVYNNLLVVLISDASRKNQPYPNIDYDKLNKLLENCDAYIAFSNATSRRSMLRTNFLLTCSTLQIAQALNKGSPLRRIFFYEEYVEYITIDLCANSFRETMGHDDIIYLTHPGVVRVYRYDKIHNTDLLNVLYCYCIKNCNISLAAEAAYMHRNTFTTRLAKLRKIFTEDLSSSEVQHRIVFSYKVIQYYEKLCKVKLTERFLQSPPV
jgi:hypothetical protein